MITRRNNYIKDELTRGAGGRIKEVEDNIVDDYRCIGESEITFRLRTQEEIHQKASAALLYNHIRYFCGFVVIFISCLINSVKLLKFDHLILTMSLCHISHN